MQRLYYLSDDLETTRRVSDSLRKEGISNWNFHVLSKDEAGLYTHHIHSAMPYQELDLVHTAQRWGLGGGALGLAFGLLGYYFQPLAWQVNGLVVALTTALGAAFGAWIGGMVGLTRENYKIAPFHDDIEAGRYLIMVDVTKEFRTRVRELMNVQFPSVQRCGSSSTFINPFDRAERLYHQSTH
jgi:hypothetical protein